MVNLKSNKGLPCHSWKSYREAGATKISLTHFEDRGANVLADISARRYFCTQCLVPQVNAPPLVENEFEPITVIAGERPRTRHRIENDNHSATSLHHSSCRRVAFM